MYFQFLIEDKSTEVLVNHVMEKLQQLYPGKYVDFNIKSFKGIGHLSTQGSLQERKGSSLLNNLRLYLRGFDRSLSHMPHASIIVVLDNDKRNCAEFQKTLDKIAAESVMVTDCVVCIAVKEMEAWLFGDEDAITSAYPNAKKKYLKSYEQDGICDTWEVLANMVYPGGLVALKKKSKNSYSATGIAKSEWADKIGKMLNLGKNQSPSFNRFLNVLQSRIETAIEM